MAVTEEAPRSLRTGPAPGRAGGAWRIASLLAVTAALAAHVWVAWSAVRVGFPTFNYDEIDTLLAGRVSLGMSSPEINGSGYFPLSATLVTPLWWLVADPFVFYRAVIVIGVLTALATIWPLARIATRFGLTTPQAVTVAGIVMTLPARTVQADYALAEKTVLLLLALTVLAAARLAERPTITRGATFGLLVALTFASHARMLVLVAAAIVWLGLLALGHRGPRRAALVGLATLVPLVWLANWWGHHVNDIVNQAGWLQGDHLLRHLSAGNAGNLLRTAVGQAWGQLVAGFGVTAVGLVVVVVRAGREVRERAPGASTLVLLTAGGLYAGSVLQWGSRAWLYATGWRRLDVWVYERYADPAFGLVVLIGLCWIVRCASERRLGVRTLAAAGVLALALAVTGVVWLGRIAPTGAFVTPAHIPGAMAWAWALPSESFWLVAGATALVPLAVLVVARSRVRAAAGLTLGLVLALGAAGSVAANDASDHYQRDHQLVSGLGQQLRSILAAHPDATVGYDDRCPTKVKQAVGLRNRIVWQLLPRIVSRTTAGVDIAIACGSAGDRLARGGIALDQPAFDLIYAWVMPGPLQDELVAAGVLRPAG